MPSNRSEMSPSQLKAMIEELAAFVDEYNPGDSRALRRFAKLFDDAHGLKLSTIIEQIRTSAESRVTRQ